MRHDSDSEDQDNPVEEVEVDEQEVQRIYEEMMLREKAKEELMKEDLEFKNISKEDIDRLLDENASAEDLKFDKHSIKKLILNLREKLNTNQEKRIASHDDPSQFLDSEADLHLALK